MVPAWTVGGARGIARRLVKLLSKLAAAEPASVPTVVALLLPHCCFGGGNAKLATAAVRALGGLNSEHPAVTALATIDVSALSKDPASKDQASKDAFTASKDASTKEIAGAGASAVSGETPRRKGARGRKSALPEKINEPATAVTPAGAALTTAGPPTAALDAAVQGALADAFTKSATACITLSQTYATTHARGRHLLLLAVCRAIAGAGVASPQLFELCVGSLDIAAPALSARVIVAIGDKAIGGEALQLTEGACVVTQAHTERMMEDFEVVHATLLQYAALQCLRCIATLPADRIRALLRQLAALPECALFDAHIEVRTVRAAHFPSPVFVSASDRTASR